MYVSLIFLKMARWQNGYAEDCKSLYAGSIPARASTFLKPNSLTFTFYGVFGIFVWKSKKRFVIQFKL